ncbi:MAG: hypothetical protein IJV27_11775 [Prevotella sp.]|nr:hypothetical protein [Prevotella sp.]
MSAIETESILVGSPSVTGTIPSGQGTRIELGWGGENDDLDPAARSQTGWWEED